MSENSETGGAQSDCAQGVGCPEGRSKSAPLQLGGQNSEGRSQTTPLQLGGQPSATGTPRSTLRIGWVLGWAVPEAWFAPLARAALPGAAHTFFPAAPDALAALRTAGPFDWLAGYSLGAQLLLGAEQVARVDPNAWWGCAATESALGSTRSAIRPRVALLAPMFAFPREENTGGRMARTQVRYLARWLRRDPAAALADFYARAGLGVSPEQAAGLAPEILQWGLDQLETVALLPVLPAGWRAWCGADDPLLDAARLQELAPEIAVVPGATHHPAALLREFSAALSAKGRE